MFFWGVGGSGGSGGGSSGEKKEKSEEVAFLGGHNCRSLPVTEVENITLMMRIDNVSVPQIDSISADLCSLYANEINSRFIKI